jgi:SAM-dependent methyltransferase
MHNIPGYVDGHQLFGRHGFRGLDFHARHLLDGVDPRGRHILEVGGGDGIMSLWLLWAGARSVTCLEPEAAGATSGTLARARMHRSELGITDEALRLLPDRFQDYQPDRELGIVLLRNSINHLDEPATERLLEDPAARRSYLELFGRVRRMLAPGGHVIMADSGRENVWGWLFTKSPIAPHIEWHKHQEPETWASVLAEAGFTPAPPTWWHPTYRGRALAPFIDNRLVARFLASYFVLRAQRT